MKRAFVMARVPMETIGPAVKTRSLRTAPPWQPDPLRTSGEGNSHLVHVEFRLAFARLRRIEWAHDQRGRARWSGASVEQARKPVTEHGPDHLAFDDPLWHSPFGPGWRAMVIYDRGVFRIKRRRDGCLLRYDLRSLHVLVFCLFAAFTFLVFGLANGAGLPDALTIGALAFAWLYGMNVLLALALARVPRAIRRAVGAA